MAFIPKTNVTTGNTILASDITNIIDAINGTGSFDIVGTGSFTGSFTGPLTGTASQAVSSSYALSSSYAVSASYAVSSSYAVSASYALSGSFTISSSYASASTSASYALSSSYAISSSYAVSASYAKSASFSSTASLAQNILFTNISSVPAGLASSNGWGGSSAVNSTYTGPSNFSISALSEGKFVPLDATSGNISIEVNTPNNVSGYGFEVSFFAIDIGMGQNITFTPSASITIICSGSLAAPTLIGKGSVATLKYISSNTWVMYGDIA